MSDTPVKDKNYDLIAAVYNNAQGVAKLNHYIEDAQGEGDQEAVEYFTTLREQYHELGERGRRILKDRL